MADKTDDLVIGVSTDMSSVQRAIRKLDGDIARAGSQIERRFAGIGKSIDKAMPSNMQSQINKMVGIQTAATKEWTGALAEQGKEMERLRSKFSPIFSTLNNYKATVKEIQAAHRLGAISADEMAKAIQRERQAALSSVAALKQRKAALSDTPNARGSNFNTSNLAAQGFDVITTAGFMPFYTVALQQGPQVAAIFNDIAVSGQKLGPALAGAFMQIVNPISLVTIGAIAAGAALVQYFVGAKGSVVDLDEIIQRHEQNIRSLGPAYEDALKKAKSYAADPSIVNLFFGADKTDAAKAQAQRQADAITAVYRLAFVRLTDELGNTSATLTTKFQPFREALLQFTQGRSTVEEFGRAIASVGEGSPGLRSLAEDLARVIKEAYGGEIAISNMTNEVGAATQALTSMSQVLANDATNAMSRLSDEQRKYIESLIEGLKSGRVSSDELRAALESLAQVSPDFSGTIGQLLNLTTALDDARKAAGNFVQTTAKTSRLGAMGDKQAEFDNAFNMWRRFGYGDDAGIEQKFKQPKAARAPKVPKKTADDRFFESLEEIRQRTIALAEEQAMLGLSYEAQVKRKTAFDLEQQALKQVREEARQKGDQDWQNAKLAPEQIRQINEVSAAYARQAAELKKAEAQKQSMEYLFGMGASALEAIVNGSEKAETAIKKLIVQLALAAAQAALLGSGPLAGIVPNFAKIPAFANGTSFAPGGMALVGERGPELVNLPRGSRVIPNVPTMRALNRGGSSSAGDSFSFAPVIQASGNAASDDRLLGELRKMFDREFTPRTRAALREIKLKSGGRV